MSMLGGLTGMATSDVALMDSTHDLEKSQNSLVDQTNNANKTLSMMWDSVRSSQSPYTSAGSNALSQVMAKLNAGTPSIGQYEKSDQYDWLTSQGTNAINNSAAAKGNLLSGGNLKALNTYNQGQASTDYQNWFNNQQTNLNNEYWKPIAALTGIANQGESATSATNQLGTTLAGETSSNYTKLGEDLATNYYNKASNMWNWSNSMSNSAGSFGAGIGKMM